MINGYDASKIQIYKGGGNGHRDYIIAVKDMPLFEENEISEVHIFTKNFALGS